MADTKIPVTELDLGNPVLVTRGLAGLCARTEAASPQAGSIGPVDGDELRRGEHEPSSPVAFYTALDLMRMAAESPEHAGLLMNEAASAAKDAFPAGSDEAGALAVLLGMDPAAVHDFTDFLSVAVLLAEAGDGPSAKAPRRRAAAAAIAAVEAGSREGRALAVLLAAARQVPEAVT